MDHFGTGLANPCRSPATPLQLHSHRHGTVNQFYHWMSRANECRASKGRRSQIIALGGHSISDSAEDDVTLSRYILDQSPAERPRICFLPQGKQRRLVSILRDSTATFWSLTFSRQTCLSSKPHTADIADFLLEQDVIYVGWRQYKVDAGPLARVGC